MLDADLAKNTPELIVDVSPISSNWDAHPMSRYPVLRQHLVNYRLESTIQGAHIYRRTKLREKHVEGEPFVALKGLPPLPTASAGQK